MAKLPKLQKLLIAVPTTGGSMKSKTAESLILVMKILTRAGIDADLRNIDNSDVVTVRNAYANMVLDSDKWDGLLFIDSDMQFAPRIVLRMIALNVLVAAAACTTRNIDLDKFGNAMRDHGDLDRAKAESSRFNVLQRWDNGQATVIKRRDGFYTMAAVGMAVCLIRKLALEAMVEESAVAKRFDVYDGVQKTSWGFFDFARHGEITLLEDYSFCHRWTHVMGRPLWVCVDEEVRHIGDFGYTALYSNILEPLLRDGAKRGEQAQIE